MYGNSRMDFGQSPEILAIISRTRLDRIVEGTTSLPGYTKMHIVDGH
jgi:hypothetical protein